MITKQNEDFYTIAAWIKTIGCNECIIGLSMKAYGEFHWVDRNTLGRTPDAIWICPEHRKDLTHASGKEYNSAIPD